jgi:hypothetical protein
MHPYVYTTGDKKLTGSLRAQREQIGKPHDERGALYGTIAD